MKINHEETKSAKKTESIFALFVSSWLIFRGPLHLTLLRHEGMKKRHGVQASACRLRFSSGPRRQAEALSPCLSSWLIFRGPLHLTLLRHEGMKKRHGVQASACRL